MEYIAKFKKQTLLRLGNKNKDSAFYILHVFLRGNRLTRDALFLNLWETYLIAYRIFDDLIDENKSDLIPYFFYFSNHASELLQQTIPADRDQKIFLAKLAKMHIHMAKDSKMMSDIRHYLYPKVTQTTHMKSFGIAAIIDAYLANEISNYKVRHQRQVHSFLANFLIGRQLSDDASDWHNDIARHTKVHKVPLRYQKLFERRLGFIYAKKITEHLEKARTIAYSLKAQSIIKDLSSVNKIIDRIYLPAKQVVKYDPRNNWRQCRKNPSDV